jgi:hypothetical protein
VDEKQWQAAVKRFSILKTLFEMDKEQPTSLLEKHPIAHARKIHFGMP